MEHDGRLITVFSAPNYCDQQGNKAAIVKIEADLEPQFITFEHVEHPPMKPMAYSNMVRPASVPSSLLVHGSFRVHSRACALPMTLSHVFFHY